jgi:hypothetical protein
MSCAPESAARPMTTVCARTTREVRRATARLHCTQQPQVPKDVLEVTTDTLCSVPGGKLYPEQTTHWDHQVQGEHDLGLQSCLAAPSRKAHFICRTCLQCGLRGNETKATAGTPLVCRALAIAHGLGAHLSRSHTRERTALALHKENVRKINYFQALRLLA